VTLAKVRGVRSIAAALALCALLGATPPIAVRTVAGSGAAGALDGPAAAAEFLMPSGIAFDRDGNLYIADAAAQNIRELTAAGAVRTIAGPAEPPTTGYDVPGGYADGPVAAAKFNRPWALAVAPDGAIYVADRQNACIRLIKDGQVSTFAGKPGRNGNVDGAIADASFQQPVALTIDSKNRLFVADEQNGIREIADGAVKTLTIDLKGRVRGVAAGEEAGRETLFVADGFGLALYDLAAGTTVRYESTLDPVHISPLQGDAELGYPWALAALSDHEVLYTDARTNTVHYLNANYVRTIAGSSGYDPTNAAGGYADGPGPEARFFAPTGIAVSKTGSVLVSDGGNRRIRSVTLPDRRLYVTPSLTNLERYPVAASDYEIAYVGNSLSWTDSTWFDSIAARVQDDLRASPVWGKLQRGRPVVVPFALPGASLAATAGFIGAVPAESSAHVIVLQMNSAYLSDYGNKQYRELVADTAWTGELTSTLRTLDARLKKNGIRLLVAFGPYGYELAPAESVEWQYDVPQSFWQTAADVDTVHEHAIAAIRAAGVDYVDAWPEFVRSEMAAQHVPLFGTTDPHMTAAGRALFGDVVSNALLR
jgi:hypothetical protein